MASEKGLKEYVKIDSNCEDLEIYIKDNGLSRSVRIKGRHVMPRGAYNCQYSELETQLSLQTLRKIALSKGRYFRDEIERGEDPDYTQKSFQILVKEFEIKLEGKRILDFGCGSGASTISLLRCGATDVTGVDVDEILLGNAAARLSNFFQNGYKLINI